MNWFEKNALLAAGITLKGFKTFRGRGEFGDAGGFEATAMLDGKVVASFCDNNDGGELRIHATPEFLVIAAKYGSDGEHSQKGEKFTYWLVGWHETIQQLKRKCKTKVVGILPDHCEGRFSEWNRPYSEELVKQIRSKFPTVFIINGHL